MKYIITHSGVFHCDDVAAVSILMSLFPSAEVIRTRDRELLEAGLADTTSILVDVGAVYDEDMLNFDHHQREGKPAPRENGVPYSSAGLIWRRFGPAFVARLTGAYVADVSDVGQFVVKYIEETLIQYIDATDCGALQGARVLRDSPDVRVQIPGISSIVSGFNPSTFFSDVVLPQIMEEEDEYPSTDQVFLARFSDASLFMAAVLDRAVLHAISIFMAKEAVEEGYRPEQRVVVLGKFVPWADHVHEVAPKALYVIFPNAQGDTVMVQQVAVKPGSFEGKKPLPESWAGLRDEAFSEEAGISDGVFCHAGRFVCGARTMESAIVLAEKAVNA